MKRIISICVIVLICAGFFSCASQPTPGETGSSVWKIGKNGNTLFLGGSVHILREQDYPLPEEFDRAFSLSAMLVLEADIELLADENVARYLMSQMILPGDQTLNSILDSDTYELLKAKYAEYGVSIDDISKLKPSMAVTMLTVLQIQKFGFEQQGVDTYYLEKAKNEKKVLNYLESVESQIDMLVTMGDGYENDYVRYSLQDMESAEAELTTFVAEWKNGDAASTEAALSEMKKQWSHIYKTLISDRNAAWLPQIEDYLASGTVAFVIVGLAHLHGPDGLLRQLKNSGCAVEYLRH